MSGNPSARAVVISPELEAELRELGANLSPKARALVNDLHDLVKILLLYQEERVRVRRLPRAGRGAAPGGEGAVSRGPWPGAVTDVPCQVPEGAGESPAR